MARYTEYNGTEVDYDLDNPVLDSGNREYNRKWGITNPKINMDTYTGDYEPDMYDPDCW
jgi:hypothetical protein